MQHQGRLPLSPGTTVAGKFRILRPLGQGGMGAVYVVEHVITRHERALKLLHPDMAAVPEVVDRFLREASAAGHIGSEHIVETFDAGTLEDGAPYLVMELLRGETLSERLARTELPLAELVTILEQACSGIQAAHDAGIVHRDLKPDNLFITERQGRPFVKILDFGISKFDPSRSGELSVTREGAALGTPYYMSPEQILGSRAVDHRTDVYALGVVLYECLTRRKPFEAETLPMLTVLIHEGRYDSIRSLRPELPAGFDQVAARAMQRQPEQRFQSTRELALALVAAARGGASEVALDRTAPWEPDAAHGSGAAPGPLFGEGTAHARSALHDPKLGTSALGVSIRPPAAERKAGRALVISGVALVLVLGAGVGALTLGKENDTASSADALVPEPPHAGRALGTATSPAPLPAPPESASAPPSAAPAPSATPSARAATSSHPQKAPARTPEKAPVPDKPARSHSESLATENPFR
jgi:eukaryotic-like serine/threonine-protein kinase